MFINKDQREIQRKLRILQHADETGHVAKTCRFFGVGRTSFCRWREAYAKDGENGLINRPSIPKQHYNRTPQEIEEKVFHLRSKYHLGTIRIVWYFERYHGISMSDATVSRILKRNGMNRLPGKPTDNAYIESFNGSFREECLNTHWFMSHDDAREKLETWRVDYNNIRPHSAIGNKAPVSLINCSSQPNRN